MREQPAASGPAPRRYTTVVLATWFAASCVLPVLFADALDAVRVHGVPLGFWFAQEGAVLAFVVLIAGYVALMNRADARRAAR